VLDNVYLTTRESMLRSVAAEANDPLGVSSEEPGERMQSAGLEAHVRSTATTQGSADGPQGGNSAHPYRVCTPRRAFDGDTPARRALGATAVRRLVLCVAGVCAAVLALSSAPAFGAIKHPFVTSFGSFTSVGGVAVDQATGDVYVLDIGAEGGTLSKYTASGEPLKFKGLPGEPSTITGLGSGGQSENELAVDNSSGPAHGDVYVAVSGGNGDKVAIIASDGTSLGALTEAVTPWGTACGVAVDPSGNVYVSLYGPIDRFTPKANPVTDSDLVASLGGADESCNIAVDSVGNVFGATWPAGPVTRFPASQFGSSSASGSLVDGGGSSLAIDPVDDHVYVNERERVSEFGPHGEPFSLSLSTFGEAGEGAIVSSEGIAVDGTSGEIYVPDGHGHLSIFGAGVLTPTVLTGQSSSQTGHTAVIEGSVNPEGTTISECKFEYGTDTSYGASVPCATNPGSGNAPAPVSAELTGLTSGTTYHYRLVATNSAGEEVGSDQALTTTQVVVTEEASGISEEGASLAGSVNPEGFNVTACSFQYGFTTAYGQSAPCLSLPGAGSASVAVTATLANLSPNGKYHYRLVVTDANGENFGGDHSLATEGPFDQNISTLPDGRVYELVTNPNGGDGEVYQPAGGNEYSNTQTADPFQASAAGDGITYLGSPTSEGNEAAGTSSGNQYMASRSASGWSANDISPHGFPSAVYQDFSSDLSIGFLDTLEGMTLESPGYGEVVNYGGNYAVLYAANGIRNGAPREGTLTTLLKTTPPYRPKHEFGSFNVTHPPFGSPGGRNYDNRLLAYAGSSADSTHVLFEANDALTPEAEGGSESSFEQKNNLYESVGGALKLVNVLPNGHTEANATFGAPGENGGNEGPDYSHVISTDGSRIFWTDLNTGHIYVRENGLNTLEISPSGKYWTASADGSKVFYTNGDLYMYDVEGETATDLTPGVTVVGVVGASENGEYVYYVTSGYHLEMWHNGVITKIKALSAADNESLLPYNFNAGGDWKPGLANRMAEVTPDGRGLVFMSTARNFNTFGSVEVYEANTNRVYCASCGSGGSRGFVPLSYSNTYLKRWVSEDGSRVFFDSPDSLVPQDQNGKLDVYEWEQPGTGSCTSSSGCIYLLSGGTSQDESFLADASTSGDDVFVITRAKLLSRDDNEQFDLYDVRAGGSEPITAPICTGSGCQGPPGAPPIFSTPASVTFEGIGNFAPAPPVTTSKPVSKPKPKSKPKKKHKRKRKRKHSKGRNAARHARSAHSHAAQKGGQS
jgi:hypothetical protein